MCRRKSAAGTAWYEGATSTCVGCVSEMLYLKSLTLDRFKSFRHAELLFSKGFTCIVGPNGSGKSNICDALLFGLGESALRRLRSERLENLISNSKKREGLRKAYVRIEFGGDANLTIVRAVRSDGKSLYRVNGRHVSRQDVLEMLSKYSIRADETNTIAQGEIARLTELRPKERRELIDIASGIKEFEYKKEEALKELEKVGQKISESNIMLNERKGFLKELESEKESAEKYLKMGARLKSLNYSTLTLKKSEAARLFSGYSERLGKLNARADALRGVIAQMSGRISELNAERSRLTQQLNESTTSMGETSSRLEGINMGLASLAAELEALQKEAAEAGKDMIELQDEEKKAAETIAKNNDLMAGLDSEIDARVPELAKLKSVKGKAPEEKDLKALESDVLLSEKRLEKAQAEAQSLAAEVSLLQGRETSMKSDAERAAKLGREIGLTHKAKGSELREMRSRLEALRKEVKGDEAELSRISSDIGRADESSINIREQLAGMRSRSSSVYESIKGGFAKRKGLYGRLSELCTYNDEHAAAVETAAAARLDYIVVDTVESASEMIAYLKRNAAGRATFIPLDEVRAEETERQKGLSPLIDFVRFDALFRKAFMYALHNTYLVSSIDEARRHGIGSRRYVTLSGELIEQSGTLTGGTLPKRSSQALLERRLNEVLESKSLLSAEYESASNKILKARKEEAYLEMGALSLEKELSTLSTEAEADARQAAEAEREAEGLSSRLLDAGKRLAEARAEAASCSEELSKLKSMLSALYSEALEASRKLSVDSGSEEMERLEGLRKEVEGFRIARAEASKEAQIAEGSTLLLAEKIKARLASIKDSKKAAAEKAARKKALEEQRHELEADIAKRSNSGKELYKSLSSVDSELTRLAAEKGRSDAEYANTERQALELRIQSSQAETRMNDLSAELSTFGSGVELIKDEIGSMEREAALLGARITELGSVNLKAPELYEEKKRSVDEVMSKLLTLETERQAVMRMITEIESKKLQTFMNALNEVSRNFSTLYSHVFTNKAAIRLENQKEPFSSGLDIEVENGRTLRTLSAMSGGEKSFISLILIFAIHMYKPSALYIFDEVDAALDKENSKKLSHLIKEMGKSAQFIVVSHNDSLIVNAETAIGVVKPGDDSKSVGIEVSSIIKGRQM